MSSQISHDRVELEKRRGWSRRLVGIAGVLTVATLMFVASSSFFRDLWKVDQATGNASSDAHDASGTSKDAAIAKVPAIHSEKEIDAKFSQMLSLWRKWKERESEMELEFPMLRQAISLRKAGIGRLNSPVPEGWTEDKRRDRELIKSYLKEHPEKYQAYEELTAITVLTAHQAGLASRLPIGSGSLGDIFSQGMLSPRYVDTLRNSVEKLERRWFGETEDLKRIQTSPLADFPGVIMSLSEKYGTLWEQAYRNTGLPESVSDSFRIFEMEFHLDNVLDSYIKERSGDASAIRAEMLKALPYFKNVERESLEQYFEAASVDPRFQKSGTEDGEDVKAFISDLQRAIGKTGPIKASQSQSDRDANRETQP